MNDYWTCEHCKSLNRAGTGKCYSCKRSYGSAPKEVPVVRSAASPAPTTPGSRPIPGAPPSAGFFTGQSVGPGVVGPGGVPVDGGDLPAYLSRPIAGPAFTSTTYLQAQEQAPVGPHPIAWLKRRSAAWLAPRQSVSVWLVGYISAGLITLLLVVAAILLTMSASAIGVAVQKASLTEAWTDLGPGRQSAMVLMGAVLAIVSLLALLFFSIFVGLSTHNAARFGVSGMRLTPGPATTCWWKMVWAHLKLAAGFLIPAGLLLNAPRLPAGPLAGLVAAFIAVEWAQRSLNDPFGFISNPANHLADVYGRIGDMGASGSLLGTAWKACFGLANLLAIVVYALPIIAVSAIAAATLAGQPDAISIKTAGMGPVQLAFMALGLPLLLTASASLGLLVPISIDMVERQRTRNTMSRVGRTRSWAEPPGGARGGTGNRNAQPAPERDRYESGGGYESAELLGGAQDRGQDRGYETRETGGYDDRGFGTGDEDRGYGTRETGGYDDPWGNRR